MNEEKKVIIIGTGGQALEVADSLRHDDRYELIGYITPENTLEYNGTPVLGNDDHLPTLIKQHKGLCAIVALGEPKLREKLFKVVDELGYEIISVVNPHSYVAESVKIGRGVCVNAGVSVNADAVIEDGVNLNTNCAIGHETKIGAFSNINPGAALGGKIDVGRYCYIGIGASVIHEIKIGEGAIIGGGAAVVKDIPARVTAVGVPCKVIKEHKE